MKYEFSPEIQKLATEISLILFPHVDMTNVRCFKSYGTSSKRTIARCHGLGKLFQKAFGMKKGFYLLEFLGERFDKLSDEDKLKTIIHELMHIPYNFGGGFKHHDHVTEKNVTKMFEKYLEVKNENNLQI